MEVLSQRVEGTKRMELCCTGLEWRYYKIPQSVIASKGHKLSTVVKVAATAVLQHGWHSLQIPAIHRGREWLLEDKEWRKGTFTMELIQFAW